MLAKRRLLCHTVFAVVGCSLVAGSNAQADLAYYTSHFDDMVDTRTSWLDDMGIAAPETTLDFETGFDQDQDILGMMLDGGMTLTSPAGYGFVTAESSDMGGSLPLGTYAVAIDEGDAYTFSFDSPISYFAFYMLDQGRSDLQINYADGTDETVIINESGGSGFNGTFLALWFDRDVDSLYIPRVNGGDGEVGVDNVEFGYTIPSPTSLSLLAIGGLTLLRRRRSAAESTA